MVKKLVTVFLLVGVFSVLLPVESSRAAAVTLREPGFGLPHTCADTDVEAMRELGYEVARDRMVQFLLFSNVGRGTLHGALGLMGIDIDDDIVARRTGYSRLELNLMFERLPLEGQQELLAYMDGVNAAINQMYKPLGDIKAPMSLKFFKQGSVAGPLNIFGNGKVLTQGEGLDPYYEAPGIGATYTSSGSQFTPELAMSFAILQVRDFGFEAWDEIGMAEALAKLEATYGVAVGTELWDDRYWVNDPLAPVSVPDPRTPGYGGPLAKAEPVGRTPAEKMQIARAADQLVAAATGRTRLPGYPMRDYTASLEPLRVAMANREATARKWGGWPSMGSYAWMIAPDRSETGVPWIGGFPQTGIQVPSLMHYAELKGDEINGRGMFFAPAPYALIGQTDNVAYTTTTAHMQVVSFYIEQLVNGDFDLLRYDHHGVEEAVSKRIELVYSPVSGINQVPVFRTNKVCSVNGCTGGSRVVQSFSGDVAGTVDSAGSNTLTDNSAVFADLSGGYVAITDGTGAGQMRAIDSSTATTITTTNAWTTTPDDSSDYVAVDLGEIITMVAAGASTWLEEGTTAAGFGRFQEATSVDDMRSAIRFIPSTHNFYQADNQPWNGVGTDHGQGNISYQTSGFMRVRQGGLDHRLPIDGTAADPYPVLSGVVTAAGVNSLSDTGAFTGEDLSAEAVNFSYDNPDDNGSEYIVSITAGDGHMQTRRVASNNNDTLTLEHDWGVVPSVGDTWVVYEIWAMPEAINPSEGYSANWNNKESVASDVLLGENGRNHRVELILEQLSLDSSINREDLRSLNKYVAGVIDPGTPGRYLLGRLDTALAVHGDCGTVDDELRSNNDFPERGRRFTNPLVVEPAGTTLAAAVQSNAPTYLKSWANQLVSDIYSDEYGAAGVGLATGDAAIGWVLHAIDAAEGDVVGAYVPAYGGDYFNGSDWKQVLHDSFCTYAAANPTIGTSNRSMRNYDHPLSALPCQGGCETPIEFDPTPRGNRGTWEQIIEVGSVVKGEFIYPMGQSSEVAGTAAGFTANNLKQAYHTSSLHPLWRDWRFAPMLHVCEAVTFGVDEDGDADNDGVIDGFETWYYDGDLSNDGSSDTDGDGATLATEYRWGSDPTLADTDGDTVPDGLDVAPQDRLCVSGTLKKLLIKDSSKAGKDKVLAKWSVPLSVCIGGDYETACTSDSDCGVVGSCRRIRMDPRLDSMRVTAGDDSAIFDADIPVSYSLWKAKNGVKFSYKDKDGINSGLGKAKITMDTKKNIVSLFILAKKIDLPAGPDAAEGVVGLSIGTRCFMETSSNCKQKPGTLNCKAD
ncbi:MAG: penicillin acylase family protein [Deltaproteobacteria bacterium]|nr:penicillin acylase family protein [Deltaproteobacteria bacterium]